MKKFLTIISCCLIVIFCFSGCSASKKQIEEILSSQITFATNENQKFDLSNNLFSDNLKTEYSTFYNQIQITNLEKMIQSSNTTLSRLKSYLQIDDFSKSLKKNDAKEINKSNNDYYHNFTELILTTNSLEEVLIKGGHNTAKDYENLNVKILLTIQSSNLASLKLINFIKENLNIEIKNDQIEVGSGILELTFLNALNNALTYFTEIYLNKSEFNNFITYETQIENPSETLSSILINLNACPSLKFDLNSTNFVALKNSILLLQTHNKQLNNERTIFNNVLQEFDYQNFEANFIKAYPNEDFNSANAKHFADGNSLNTKMNANYKYISSSIYGKLNPTISILNEFIISIKTI